MKSKSVSAVVYGRGQTLFMTGRSALLVVMLEILDVTVPSQLDQPLQQTDRQNSQNVHLPLGEVNFVSVSEQPSLSTSTAAAEAEAVVPARWSASRLILQS